MRNFLFACFFSLMSAFSLFSCGLHELPLTETRMVEALQQALFLGSQTAADNLGDGSCVSSKVEAMDCATGYLGNKLVEIIVPDTVQKVLSFAKSFTNSFNSLNPSYQTAIRNMLGTSYSSILDLSRYGDSIKVALNRGAEMAAPASIDVFEKAIFGMSFGDAKEVLLGDSTAATDYLNVTTYSDLKRTFGPFIEEPLKSLDINKFWKPIASGYNALTTTYKGLNLNTISALPKPPYDDLPTDLTSSLTDYATGKALNGLFKMVGKQEASLRADPWGTASAVGGAVGDLLGDVFSKAKDGLI